MTTLDVLVDKLSQAAAMFGLPAEVHGVVPLLVTDENGELTFRALDVSERAIRLGTFSGWNLAVAEIDLKSGAITVPSSTHGLVRLLDALAARIPNATTWLGLRQARQVSR